MAEINTTRYASVVQSAVDGMSWYWTPIEQFGKDVITGDINLQNYKEKVDELVNKMNP